MGKAERYMQVNEASNIVYSVREQAKHRANEKANERLFHKCFVFSNYHVAECIGSSRFLGAALKCGWSGVFLKSELQMNQNLTKKAHLSSIFIS